MIHVDDIGIGLDMTGSRPELAFLERELEAYRHLGYRLVEIDPVPFALIVDGEIRSGPVERFRAVVRDSGLRCSVHGLCRLNLAYDTRHDLCKRIMAAQIRLCEVLGASHLVYHSGLQALDDLRHGVRRTLLTARELEEGARREVAALRELGRRAADVGVVICMENLDPHLWELQVVEQHGRPATDIAVHVPRLMVGPIVRQLEAVGSENVGMTMDFAHLLLASNALGFPYLEAVREAAPWLRHLHVNDNCGRLDHGPHGDGERCAYGEADMHMPPGWGQVPYHEALGLLSDYRGDLILEISGAYRDSYGESLASIRAILDSVRGSEAGEGP